MKLLRLCLAALLLPVVLAASASAADRFSWRYFSVIPATHDYAKNLIETFETIDKKSDGRLKIRFVFYGETPYKAFDALAVLKNGQVQMTEWLPTYSAGTYPLVAAPELPYLLPSMSDVAKAQETIDQAWAAPAMQAALKDVVGGHGASVLAHYYYEPMNFWFTTPVASLAEFKDKRIRVFSPELGDLVTATGASAVSMASPELYSALQRNALSGVITGVGNLGGGKLDEVLRAGFVTNLMFTSTTVLASDAAVAELPDDLKSILRDEMAALNLRLKAFMPESDRTKKEKVQGQKDFSITMASAADYAALREIASTKVWPAWQSRAGAGAEDILKQILKAVEAK